jgi:hypothetical protein
VVLATRDTLVGQYVGHTGPKTKEVIKQALGGILFIDEAYYLYNAGNDRDYGVESIEILLKVRDSMQYRGWGRGRRPLGIAGTEASGGIAGHGGPLQRPDCDLRRLQGQDGLVLLLHPWYDSCVGTDKISVSSS